METNENINIASLIFLKDFQQLKGKYFTRSDPEIHRKLGKLKRHKKQMYSWIFQQLGNS